MKRSTALFITICLLGIMTTACGNAPSKEEKSTVPDRSVREEEEVTEEISGESHEDTKAEEMKTASEENESSFPVKSKLRIAKPLKGIFADELPYEKWNCQDLAAKGTMKDDDYDRYVEYTSDMLSAKDAIESENYPRHYVYGDDCTVQEILYEDLDESRIMEARVSTGNPYLDNVMKSVGYKDYEVTYCYSFLAFAEAGEAYSEPLLAFLNIDGKNYEYDFYHGELVARSGPEGDSRNTKTNDFINQIYKIGCYYGNVIDGERDRISLMVTSPDAYEDYGDAFVISAGIQGRDGIYEFIVDKDTVFAKGAPEEYFQGYIEGETPLEWMRHTYDSAFADPENISDVDLVTLMGFFDVKVNEGHIDTFIASYWWD